MSIVITIIVFIKLKENYLRLILMVFFSFSFPKISYPLDIDTTVFSLFFMDNFLDSDRIQINGLLFAIFTLMFLYKVTLELITEKKFKYLSLLWLFLFLLMVIVFSYNYYNYYNYSIYQVIMDIFYFFALSSVCVYLRTRNRYEIKKISIMFVKLFKYFGFIVVFDLLIGFSELIPWSISYRNSIQGVLYALEVPYSITLAFIVIYLYYFSKNNFLKNVITAVGIYLIYLTKIKTAVLAVVFALILNKIKDSRFSAIINIYTILFTLLLIYINIEFIVTHIGSISSRLGTVVVYINLLFDGNIFAGIFPGGISTPYMQSNLAIKAFEFDYVNYLTGWPNEISRELILRSDYNIRGAFLPHNAIVLLLASYGFIMFFPVIYYSFVIIYSYTNIDFKSMPKEIKFYMGLLLTCVIFSLFHPYLLLIEVIFFIEIIGFELKKHKEKNVIKR
jgi:hypothetical protein